MDSLSHTAGEHGQQQSNSSSGEYSQEFWRLAGPFRYRFKREKPQNSIFDTEEIRIEELAIDGICGVY